ncbi:hypothetical protein C8F01DRAFT_1163406 [Mycena amicta]|nr:hypothetical protein C8F01DRAFT_1163406 [Mycena amicta]
MHVVLFGASGAMGLAIARRFLSVYHSSTLVLYVRDATKLPPDIVQDRSVIVVEGQLDEPDNLSKAMDSGYGGVTVDAVITALGPTGRKGPLYPPNKPIAAAYARIIATMKLHGVKRLIALTTPSVRDPSDQFSLPLVFLRTTFAALARNVVKDIVSVGDVVRTDGAELEWTLIRLALHTKERPAPPPPGEVVGFIMDERTLPIKGSISMRSLAPSSTDGYTQVIAGYMGDGNIRAFSSRGGVAAFIIDELEKREWIQKAPILSTP